MDSVKTEGVGAALIVTDPHRLLDRIATVEVDFGLPRGVEARRRNEYHESYYELISAKPEEMDRHIGFARMAGLRAMDVYYRIFCKAAGHFPWREEYPRGIEDVKRLVDRITAAEITPGIHIHYNKVNKDDAYVTPLPDPRLNLTANLTLREEPDERGQTITVEESPRRCPMEEGRRILKIRNELIEYARYTTAPPYQFIGCQRPHPPGSVASLWPPAFKWRMEIERIAANPSASARRTPACRPMRISISKPGMRRSWYSP